MLWRELDEICAEVTAAPVPSCLDSFELAEVSAKQSLHAIAFGRNVKLHTDIARRSPSHYCCFDLSFSPYLVLSFQVYDNELAIAD